MQGVEKGWGRSSQQVASPVAWREYFSKRDDITNHTRLAIATRHFAPPKVSISISR